MRDMIGGERPLPPSKLCSPLLRAHGQTVAAYCVSQCYERWPELEQRYGLRGRQHVTRDARWHLEHLDQAITAGDPKIFAHYVDWLVGLLQPRGIKPEHVAGVFGFLAERFEAIKCPARMEGDRVLSISILRGNQSRVLANVPERTWSEAAGGRPGYTERAVPAADTSKTRLSTVYFNRLIKKDRQGAFEIAEGYLGKQGEVLDFYVDVLEPALLHTGQEWERGQVSIAMEHYISDVTCEIIRRYGPRAGSLSAEVAPVAVASCVPRERHAIGLRMVADALRAGGFEVHLLGEGLPARAIVDLVVQVRADLLCLSCTMTGRLSAASNLIRLARRSRAGLKVAIGGAALRELGAGAAKLLGADWTAADAREVGRSLPAWRLSMRRTTRPHDPEVG